MFVRYLVSEASLLQEWQPGEIYDLPEAQALAAIRAGKAEGVSTYPEAATRSASEAAVMQRARGRRV